MTLALLCQFTAQHVSDVNTSIFRSLRLLGALLCKLYCAVMTEVYVLIYLSSGVIPILCVYVALSECVPASVWCPVVLEHFCVSYVLVFYASVLMSICMSCTYLTWGVLVLCTNSQSRYITPKRLKSAQYSLHNNAPSSRKLLKMDVLTSETCWVVNWHNKASVIKLVYLYSNINMMQGPNTRKISNWTLGSSGGSLSDAAFANMSRLQ